MPILGVDAVVKMFGSLPDKLKQLVVRDALKRAVSLIAAAIQDATPEGHGLLKAAIKTKVRVASDGQSATGTISFGDMSLIAARVEFGHVQFSHVAQGHKEVGIVAPAPFIFIALDRALPEAMAVFDEALALSTINFEA